MQTLTMAKKSYVYVVSLFLLAIHMHTDRKSEFIRLILRVTYVHTYVHSGLGSPPESGSC